MTGPRLLVHGFPANNDIAGLNTLRGLLDKNNLHCAGWHGDMTESAWTARVAAAKILGCDSIGSGGFPNPGIGSYDNTLRTVEALNRLGKQSIEGGVGPVYFHNHQGEFRSRYIDNGVRKTAWQIVVERMDNRHAFAEIDAGWSSDAYDDPTGTKTAALINQFPNSVKMLHIKDVNNVAPATPPASGDPLDGTTNASPVAFGTGQIDYRPIFAAAVNRVQYYHQEQDGGSLNDAAISATNLKGTGSNVKGSSTPDDLRFGPGRHRRRGQRAGHHRHQQGRRPAHHHGRRAADQRQRQGGGVARGPLGRRRGHPGPGPPGQRHVRPGSAAAGPRETTRPTPAPRSPR